MKQIINGKSYNTESATEIAEDYEQALYATDKAAWFLEYKAGSLRKFSARFAQMGLADGLGTEKRGSRLYKYKRKKKLVFSPTTKRLEEFGKIRAKFPDVQNRK